jgi:hypothetical protein
VTDIKARWAAVVGEERMGRHGGECALMASSVGEGEEHGRLGRRRCGAAAMEERDG